MSLAPKCRCGHSATQPISLSDDEWVMPYLKSEFEIQKIKLKSLGIDYDKNGITWEQCINTVIYLCGDYKNKVIECEKQAVLQQKSVGIKESEVENLLHTILNCQFEIIRYEGLRESAVRVYDIETCFHEYFGIKWKESEF